ncbi:TrbC/VirB2 family protein [Bartonella sp. CB178]|uniref:TrbC/VirB2 family protein n=1 Tax=Bartonella sp. CB178 TaxID=3112255 RepID=UPI00300DFC63
MALSGLVFVRGFGTVESSLQKRVKALTGSVSKSIATITVIGVGIAWIDGYIELHKAFFGRSNSEKCQKTPKRSDCC